MRGTHAGLLPAASETRNGCVSAKAGVVIPFKSLADEASAIHAMLATDLAKKLDTYSPTRLAKFKSDALKTAAHMWLLTNSQGY